MPVPVACFDKILKWKSSRESRSKSPVAPSPGFFGPFGDAEQIAVDDGQIVDLDNYIGRIGVK
jgi:hypothetical protein